MYGWNYSYFCMIVIDYVYLCSMTILLFSMPEENQWGTLTCEGYGASGHRNLWAFVVYALRLDGESSTNKCIQMTKIILKYTKMNCSLCVVQIRQTRKLGHKFQNHRAGRQVKPKWIKFDQLLIGNPTGIFLPKVMASFCLSWALWIPSYCGAAQTICTDDRRKFRSQTSDNMDRWKAEQGRGREKRKIRRKKSRRERVRRKKMEMREKVGKSRNTAFFQWFGAPEGRKVGSLKRRVRSQLARWEMKNCTPLWREAHLQVKMYKAPQLRTTFGSCDVEKVHAVVARSTFPSQNVQSTPLSDHFWKLRCRKSARRCGAKHISTSKCTKHTILGPLLEVAMSKKCTPLWREAHFQVKMYKTHQVRTTFGSSDVEKVHAVVARSTFPSQNVQNTHMFAPLLEVRMLKKCTPLWREGHFEVKMLKPPGVRTTFGGSDVASLHHPRTTLHYTTLHYTTLQLQLHNYTPLHSTTLNYTTLHYTTLHYTPLHYITLNDTAPQIDR